MLYYTSLYKEKPNSEIAIKWLIKYKKQILKVIYQAVELKRAGKFNQANKIYIDLDKANPNTPTILKSWAKIMVCCMEKNGD